MADNQLIVQNVLFEVDKNDEEFFLEIDLEVFGKDWINKKETIALRDFLNSLDLEPKQELNETVLIEHSENFIHLRTNNVPEWVKRLEELNRKIIASLEDKKDCKDGQHSGETGKCNECGKTYIHGK